MFSPSLRNSNGLVIYLNQEHLGKIHQTSTAPLLSVEASYGAQPQSQIIGGQGPRHRYVLIPRR